MRQKSNNKKRSIAESQQTEYAKGCISVCAVEGAFNAILVNAFGRQELLLRHNSPESFRLAWTLADLIGRIVTIFVMLAWARKAAGLVVERCDILLADRIVRTEGRRVEDDDGLFRAAKIPAERRLRLQHEEVWKDNKFMRQILTKAAVRRLVKETEIPGTARRARIDESDIKTDTACRCANGHVLKIRDVQCECDICDAGIAKAYNCTLFASA